MGAMLVAGSRPEAEVNILRLASPGVGTMSRRYFVLNLSVPAFPTRAMRLRPRSESSELEKMRLTFSTDLIGTFIREAVALVRETHESLIRLVA